MSDMVDALRATAEKLSRLPHSTGVEEAFRQLAKELDSREKRLDSYPYVYIGDNFKLQGERKAWGADQFFGPDEVSFEPREGYEQDKEKYS
jgi:hypothetical protein